MRLQRCQYGEVNKPEDFRIDARWMWLMFVSMPVGLGLAQVWWERLTDCG